MTEFRINHPKSAIERIYLLRKQGYRWLFNLEISALKQATNLKNYFKSKSSTSPIHKAIVNIDIKLSPLNLSNRSNVNQLTLIDQNATWKHMSLYGRFANSLSNADRPDIIIIDKIKKSVKLIDLAHPYDHNLNTSLSNKITKYKDLADEIKAMWQMNKV